MIKPRALRIGDTIGIVAPAGPIEPADLEAGIRRLEGLGYKTRLGRFVGVPPHRYLAARDEERAADVSAMIADPGVSAVVSARGGYGSARLIPKLDLDRIRPHPKIVVGSSDLTLLLAFLQKALGWIVFHGPMIGPNFGRTPSTLTDESFKTVLSLEVGRGGIEYPQVRVLKAGGASGRLMGGCLSLLVTTLGTPYEIQTDGAILFLEDVNEAPYRVDRMLSHLRAAGKFRGVRGIVFGKMVDCHPDGASSFSLDDVILDCLSDFPGPILADFPAGHGGEQVTLPLGTRVRCDGEAGRLILEESSVACPPG